MIRLLVVCDDDGKIIIDVSGAHDAAYALSDLSEITSPHIKHNLVMVALDHEAGFEEENVHYSWYSPKKGRVLSSTFSKEEGD